MEISEQVGMTPEIIQKVSIINIDVVNVRNKRFRMTGLCDLVMCPDIPDILKFECFYYFPWDSNLNV